MGDTIHPLAVKIEQEFACKLFTEKEQTDHYFKINIRSFLRADLKSQTEYYKAGINFSWLKTNDIRDLEDMNREPELDTFMRAANIVPFDTPVAATKDKKNTTKDE